MVVFTSCSQNDSQTSLDRTFNESGSSAEKIEKWKPSVDKWQPTFTSEKMKAKWWVAEPEEGWIDLQKESGGDTIKISDAEAKDIL